MEKNNLEHLIFEKSATYERKYEWIFREKQFWSAVSENIPSTSLPYELPAFSKYQKILTEQIEYYNRDRTFERFKLERLIELSKEFFIPNHDHRIAGDVDKNLPNRSMVQVILYSNYLLDQTMSQFFTGTVTTKYKEQLDEKIVEFNDAKQKFTGYSEYLTSHLIDQNEKSTKEIRDITETSKQTLKDEANAHSKEISEAASNIKNSIDSSAPVAFWEGKERYHREHAYSCKKAAILLGSFASILMLLLIFAAFRDPNTTLILGFQLPNHFYLAALILIGSAFVWALRISIQLMMTHVALESEALERSTAIKTYIALSNQNIDKDIEKEFHKSLLSFNKVKISEDSNHPEAFKLIEQLLSKNKS
ncbi:hypothetical protein ACN429_11665 [Pseudomonas oryzihabitans]|uniref:hypothetical protein n=1 Tax=Pseudomonas oryzihabitans TaxID=47885 RepID=UPI003B21E49F